MISTLLGGTHVRPHPHFPSERFVMHSVASADENEILSQRTFDVSADKLFAAWRDPARLARWWGPTGFTNTFEHFDFQVGSEWRFVMHGPDGKNYPNHSRFLDIVPDERIVIEHLSAPHFIVTADFIARGQQTHLTFRMRFDTAEVRDGISGIVVPANEQNFDRLEAELARTGSA